MTSHTRDIVVIGASAGGIDATKDLLRALPRDLKAAVFLVIHIGASSRLPEILDSVSEMPVRPAAAGKPVKMGCVYVAVPDRHLLLHDGHMLVRRGPRENLVRPAIDALFRSAAASFGARVIGIVLSGALNDGTAGLLAIKRCGGLAMVQDRDEAIVPEMPVSALKRVDVDYCVPVARMSGLLMKLVGESAGETPDIPMEIRLEAAIAAQELGEMVDENRLGRPSPFSCPDCQGTLWEVDDPGMLRFRCRVGHAFTADIALAAKNNEVDQMLWKLLRAHEERSALVRRTAERERALEHHNLADHLEARAADYARDAELVRRLMMEHNHAPDPNGIGDAGQMRAADDEQRKP